MNKLTKQLLKVYKEHTNLIIGVDFDDTVFPFNKSRYNILRCTEVVKQLLLLKENYNITICMYTVAGEESLIYKEEIMRLKGIKPAYINESPIKLGNGVKPYFNLLLDDKAGLNETLEVITELNNLKQNNEDKN